MATRLREFLSGGSIDRDYGRVSKVLALFYMFVVHIFYPMERTYEKRYGQSCSHTPPRQQSRPERNLYCTSQFMTTSIEECSSRVDFTASPQAGNWHWRWRGMPRMVSGLTWFRAASTVGMVYAIIKSAIPNVAPRLDSLLKLKRPLHCYMVGRFVLQQDVNQMTSFLLASYHLGWRYIQLYAGNTIFCSTIYVLLMDRSDIKLFNKLMDAKQAKFENKTGALKFCRPTGTHSEGAHRESGGHQSVPTLNKKDQFMHDVMSFKIEYGSGTRYELRPNRTLKACDDVRRLVVIFTLMGTAILFILTIVITTLILMQILNVRTYLQEYSGCSPEVQELEASGKLPAWSFQLITMHQVIALVADVLENFFIWFESGLVAVFDFSLTILLNYDLYLYWWHVDKDIEETLRLVLLSQAEEERKRRERRPRSSIILRVQSEASDFRHLHPHDVAIFDQSEHSQQIANRIFRLQMQIQDFIKEIDRTNQFITDSYSVLLTMWFTIFAYWTYKIFSKGIPPSITVLLSTLLFIVTLTGVIILIIQRNCKRSYPKICSLMAYDRSQYKRNFIKILDYFVKNRTCFTIFRGYAMKSSTLLTTIGYSFSCFFIVGSMYNR